jgi:hypothetical protein
MEQPRIVSNNAFTVICEAIDTTQGSREIGESCGVFKSNPNRKYPRVVPGVSYGVTLLDRSRDVVYFAILNVF